MIKPMDQLIDINRFYQWLTKWSKGGHK